MKFSPGQRIVINKGIAYEGRGGLVIEGKPPNGFSKLWVYAVHVDGTGNKITYYNENELDVHPNPHQPDEPTYKFNVGDTVKVVNRVTVFKDRKGVILRIDPKTLETMPYKVQLEGTDSDGAMYFGERELQLELNMNTKLKFEDLIPSILEGFVVQIRTTGNSYGFMNWTDLTKGEALQWVGSPRGDFELRLKPQEATIYMGVYLNKGIHNVSGVWDKPDHVGPKDNSGRPLIDRLQLVVFDGRVKSVKVV
jgi:hypothetical protein